MIWLVLNLRKYFAWVYQSYLVNHVRLKDIQLIVLISMVFKSINVDIMVDRTLRSLALEIELTEVAIIS